MTGSVAGSRRLERAWQGVVEYFAQKKSRLSCTLLLQWEEGYEHPWAVITDRSPQEAKVAWYGLRSWIEASFKDSKSGGATSQSCRLASCQLKNLYLKGDQSRPYGAITGWR